MSSLRTKLLPQISSPLARRFILYLFNNTMAWTDTGEEIPPGILRNPVAMNYWRELSEKLPRAGLEFLIPAGNDLLPDINEEMPQALQLYFNKTKPKSMEELATHLVQYLDLYVLGEVNRRSIMNLIYVFNGFVIPLLIFAASDIPNVPGILLLIGGIGLALLVASWVVAYLLLRKQYPDDATRQMINATLLYRHLREAFADTADSGNGNYWKGLTTD